jgi:hypothetical protein
VLNEASYHESTNGSSSVGLNIVLVLAPDTSGCLHAPATLPNTWLNTKLHDPQSLSQCSSLATSVANHLSNKKCKMHEKPHDSESPGNVSHNWQLCHMIHPSDTETSHEWLHSDDGNDLCTQTAESNILQSNCTGWGSESTGHSCPGLTMIHSSRQVHTGTSWMLLSQSPKTTRF